MTDRVRLEEPLDEEEEEPSTSAGTTRRDRNWRKVNIQDFDAECDMDPILLDEFDDYTPMDYFQYFIDDDIIRHIVDQTNLYAAQKDINTTFNVDESGIRTFLGINILSGIVKMPSYRMFWAYATRFPPIADAMPRNQFERIKSNLHLNDNSKMKDRNTPGYDKLFKVRPFLEKVQTNLSKIKSDEHNSVDEVLIPCKSRKAMVQYIKSKPHKWGIKMFARCSSAGFMYEFEVYTGKSSAGEKSDLGISGDVVLRLCKDLPKQQNYKIFTDNWFSSFKLACHLKEIGILMAGAVRVNRLPGCQFTEDKILKKKGRGAFDFRTEVNSNICAIKWFDNKPVHLVSSFLGPDPVNNVQRWSAEKRRYVEVPRPNIVAEYNQHMGGVDLNDMLVALYRMDMGTKRYYFRIFYRLIDICIVNSWLLYRKVMAKKNIKKVKPLMVFKAEVAHGLLTYRRIFSVKRTARSREHSESPPTRSPRPGPSRLITTDARFDDIGHTAIYAKRARCKHCTNINSYSRIKCKKCNVNLCITQNKDCFEAYHTK